MLDKKTTLYDRDEDGNLLPMEVELEIDESIEGQKELKGETVKITPISRGKIKRLFSEMDDSKDRNADFDGKVIKEHCVSPSYSDEEIKALKPVIATTIVNTIFRESGIKPKKSRKSAMLEAEDDFAKN